MEISKTLLEQTGPKRRMLICFAHLELRANNTQSFTMFMDRYRTWAKLNQSDRVLEYCLRRLAEAGLVRKHGSLQTEDLIFAVTERGVEVAREAYQLAQNGINDFASLLPAAAPVAASALAVDPTASQRTSPLFNIAPLGSRPTIVNSELS